MYIFLRWQSSAFRVTWSFRNHSNMLIWYSRNIFYLLPTLKTVVLLNIFCRNWFFFQTSLMYRKFTIATFIWNRIFNNVNIFTVTFDQFDVSLINKKYSLLLTDSKLLNCFSPFKKDQWGLNIRQLWLSLHRQNMFNISSLEQQHDDSMTRLYIFEWTIPLILLWEPKQTTQ